MATEQDYNELDLQVLQDLQYNAVDYVYNLEPQQNNLFYVGGFYDPYDQDNVTDGYIVGAKKPKNIEYRIKKVSGFKLPALDVSDDMMGSAFRWTYVSTGRTKSNQLSIDWLEDAFWSVRRYHMNWINCWYNKFLDCMVVGQRGKFRNLVLYLYHYKNVNDSSAVPVQMAMPIARFEFKGLVPLTSGDASFDWGNPGNGEYTSIQYKYNYLEIYFYPFNDNERNFIGGLADIIQKADSGDQTKPKDVWNTGITGYTDTLEGMKPDGQFSGFKDGMHESVYYI